jgi:hypothetical protein
MPRKAEGTKAGKYVREETHHVRRGKHGARSSKQAIAIGLSKARRAGVKVPQKRSRRSGRRSSHSSSSGGGRSGLGTRIFRRIKRFLT